MNQHQSALLIKTMHCAIEDFAQCYDQPQLLQIRRNVISTRDLGGQTKRESVRYIHGLIDGSLAAQLISETTANTTCVYIEEDLFLNPFPS